MSDHGGNKNSGDFEAEKVVEMRKAVMARKAEEEEKNNKKNEESGLPSSFIIDCLKTNELGDAQLFVKLQKNRFLYNSSEGRWYIWTGHVWKPDIMDRAQAAVETVSHQYCLEAERIQLKIRHLYGDPDQKDQIRGLERQQKDLLRRVDRLRTVKGRSNCLQLAHTCDAPLSVDGSEIDQKPWLLACLNGLIDLKSADFRPGKQDDYLSKSCAAEWMGYAPPDDTWIDCLDKIFLGNKELIDFTQRVFGMAIIGEVVENAIFILEGNGANGKSTLVEAISGTLGDYSVTLPVEMILKQRIKNSSGPSPDIMALKGKRIGLLHEPDEHNQISGSSFKGLSGNDTLTGRNPHDRQPSQFRPSHTLFLLTNERLGAPGHDYAFWRRVYILPFNARFVEGDPQGDNEFRRDNHLLKKLEAERPAILAWLVEGCLLYQQQGLNPPAIVKELTAAYQKEEDLLGNFLENCCILDPALSVGAIEIYNAFEEWFVANIAKRAPAQKTFGRWMTKKFDKSRGKVTQYHGVGLI